MTNVQPIKPMQELALFDGLENLASRMGTGRDKASYTTYTVPVLTIDQAMNAYRGSWLAQKIVDAPADDACREWRSWQAKGLDISAIEKAEAALGVRVKVLHAMKLARAAGGCALYIGTDDTDVSLPLDPEAMKAGGIRYLALLTRTRLSPGQMDVDTASPYFGTPRDYTLQAQDSQPVIIHPSRLIVFVGVPHLDPETCVGHDYGWGDSILMAALRAVTNADATAANIASMVFEAKVDVFSIENFAQQLAQGGQMYEAQILRRFMLANQMKGINGAVLLDSKETYEQKTLAFTGLPDVQSQFLQMVAGAADIPLSRLLGESAQGLNATGTGDMKNYHDSIKTIQTTLMSPAMTIFDLCLIRHAGIAPEGVWYAWNPLEQMSEAERSEINKRNAEAAKMDVDSALIPADALAIGRQNQLVESGTYPGLEQALLESKKLAAAENDTTEPADADADALAAVSVGDASPRSLYVSRKVTNSAAILAWAKAQDFTTTLEADDLHVTIAYSRDAIDWMKVGSGWGGEKDGTLTIPAGGPRLMEKFGEATVLVFGSSELSWRHMAIREAGASWDHPDYNPHITISYGFTGDLREIEPYRGAIELGPEIFEEIVEDWKSKVKES